MGNDALIIIDTERSRTKRRFDELLLTVLERTESDRRAFLEKACEGDETLLLVEEERGSVLHPNDRLCCVSSLGI